MIRRLLLLASLTLAAPVAAAIDADALLSAPLASELKAAPAAGRIAWVADVRGVRNLWVADPGPAGYRSRPLTTYTADDGNDLADVAWSSDGQWLAYVRGGEIEGGRAPNFTGASAGIALREIWLISASGGAPRKLAAGRSPAFSPRGDLIAYLDGGLFIVPTDGNAAPRRVADQGDAASISWSPDGSRLAFVSERRDQDLVGVLDLASGTTTWMAPGFDEDRSPVWSPDGQRVAFVRIAAHRVKSNTPRPAGEPWSLWAADARTGIGRQVFRAEAGPGSVFEGLDGGPRSLIWAAGDTLVFPWERTGWTNLYCVPVSGGAPRNLTPGAFEVFAATPTRDGAAVVYSANWQDLDTRHLRKVTIASGDDRALTDGAAFEDRPAVASDGTIVFLQGAARFPFRPTMLRDGRSIALPGVEPAASFPAAQLVVPRVVRFAAADGLQISGQLFEPPGPSPAGGRPAILYFHGGPARQMLAGYNPSIFYARSYAMNQWLAAQGYTVLSVNYRGGIGYGLGFREPSGFGISGASEVADIRGAATYLAGLAGVDRRRIGIYGASYGGHMTALGLARVPDLLAAGVDYAGVHDWRAYASQLERHDAPAGAADLAWRSSALSDLTRWRAPVLVAASGDDRDVSFGQSVALVEALRSWKVDVEELVFPNEVHDLRLHRSWLTWCAATGDFFARRLSANPAKGR